MSHTHYNHFQNNVAHYENVFWDTIEIPFFRRNTRFTFHNTKDRTLGIRHEYLLLEKARQNEPSLQFTFRNVVDLGPP